MSTRSLGLGHQDHPLIAHRVIDSASGRTGILRAICPEPDSAMTYMNAVAHRGAGRPVAWLAPIGGGREWTTTPDAIQEAPM